MPYGTLNADKVVNSDSITSGGLYGFKNRIINGAMVIDQRNAGAAIAYTAATQSYLVDRFLCYLQQASKFTIQQNQGAVTPPAGFTNYLGFTSSAATSPGSTDLYAIAHKIEGFNTSDLAWGTASAQPITLSFWVRSSLTGTFGGSFFNSAGNRNYVFSYTISVANTWEQKSVTIAGDTSGTWPTTSGTGIQIWWNLGSGSSNLGTAGAWGATNFYGPSGSQAVVGTNGATFYITGVQLEKGSTATSFDYRPYGTELALCQRYYFRMSPSSTTGMFGAGFNYSTSLALYYQKFPVNMRAAPTALEQSGTAAHYGIYYPSGTFTCSSVPTFNTADFDGATTSFTYSGLTAGQGTIGRALNASAYLGWSAEL